MAEGYTLRPATEAYMVDPEQAIPLGGTHRLLEDPLRIIPLGSSVLVQWNDRYCETLFLDGTRVKALAEPENPEQVRQAIECGYYTGGDYAGEERAAIASAVRRLSFEHEACHTLLARARDLPVSPVLWEVAHEFEVLNDPAKLAEHYTEESEVLALQRYLNTGDHNNDPNGRLSALAHEFDLPAWRAAALRILRPQAG